MTYQRLSYSMGYRHVGHVSRYFDMLRDSQRNNALNAGIRLWSSKMLVYYPLLKCPALKPLTSSP